eukprot:6268448-Prymnesium_polylepis.1
MPGSVERMVASSRRAGVGAAHWRRRRRPGQGPKPYMHCVFSRVLSADVLIGPACFLTGSNATRARAKA